MALWTWTQDINTDFDEDAEILLLASCCNEDNEKMKKRKYWVHPILQKRNELGEFHTLIPELELDSERFKGYFRMTPAVFNELYDLVRNNIKKQHTRWREPISPREQLAISLRWAFIKSMEVLSYPILENMHKIVRV